MPRTTDQPWEMLQPTSFDRNFTIIKKHEDGLSTIATIPDHYPHLAALFMASPELLASVATPLPSSLPGGTLADDLCTIAGILEDDPQWAVLAHRLREKAQEIHAAITKAKGEAS